MNSAGCECDAYKYPLIKDDGYRVAFFSDLILYVNKNDSSNSCLAIGRIDWRHSSIAMTTYDAKFARDLSKLTFELWRRDG